MSCPFTFPRSHLLAIVPFCTLILFYLSSCEEEKTDALNQEYTKVSTLAGGDAAGFADGSRSLASFNQPCGIAVDWTGKRIKDNDSRIAILSSDIYNVRYKFKNTV